MVLAIKAEIVDLAENLRDEGNIMGYNDPAIAVLQGIEKTAKVAREMLMLRAVQRPAFGIPPYVLNAHAAMQASLNTPPDEETTDPEGSVENPLMVGVTPAAPNSAETFASSMVREVVAGLTALSAPRQDTALLLKLAMTEKRLADVEESLRAALRPSLTDGHATNGAAS